MEYLRSRSIGVGCRFQSHVRDGRRIDLQGLVEGQWHWSRFARWICTVLRHCGDNVHRKSCSLRRNETSPTFSIAHWFLYWSNPSLHPGFSETREYVERQARISMTSPVEPCRAIVHVAVSSLRHWLNECRIENWSQCSEHQRSGNRNNHHRSYRRIVECFRVWVDRRRRGFHRHKPEVSKDLIRWRPFWYLSLGQIGKVLQL